MAGQSQLTTPIKMSLKRRGDTRIHTFISAFTGNNIANATHIIESKSKLVLIDAQFLAPYALQFRDYANSLKKPIDRLYISHRHPDHWFGVGPAFADIDIYALPETIAFTREHGEESRKDHQAKLGNLAPERVVVPQHAVATPSEEAIDGVAYVFSKVIDTEIDFHLVARLPELGVCIAQDLIYSGTHLYLTKDLQHWILLLQELLLSDCELFLAGHGFPADKNEVAKNIEYLCAAEAAIGNGLKNEAFKNFMLQRYPERKCPAIFDIYLPRLFDGASQY